MENEGSPQECFVPFCVFHVLLAILQKQKNKLDAHLANRYHGYVFSVIRTSRLESKHLMFSKYCHFFFDAPIFIKKSLTFLSVNALLVVIDPQACSEQKYNLIKIVEYSNSSLGQLRQIKKSFNSTKCHLVLKG